MGVTMQLPSKEQYIVRKEYMVDRLSVLMGGRAAENIIFSTATSGAENDLKQATKIARKMVLDWGMSDEFENMAYGEESEQVFLGKDLSSSKKYSEETGASIDKSIKKILDQANKTARDILTKYSDQLDKIAELLLEHEEIEGKQVDELLSAEE
jgi:cell division protease FtsH